MSCVPIFIGGMFKSGTTLLRAMLAQHTAIASGLETYWFDFEWSSRYTSAMMERIDRLAGYFDFDRDEVAMIAASAESPELFLDSLMARVTVREGKSRWAEKTPGNITHMNRIWTAWPDAQIIHILRDPRDVFASLVEAKKWDTTGEFAERWCATVGRGYELLSVVSPRSELYFEVRYEHLILFPETTARKILKFLGEKWEPQVATFSGSTEDFDKVLCATGKASTTLERLKEPLTTQRIGIWRHILSDTQVAEIEDTISSRGHGDLYRRIVAETPIHNQVV
jgi:hypothetical protein